MGKFNLFDAWINPLMFNKAEEYFEFQDNEPPNLQSILQFLCEPGTKIDVKNMIERYKEIRLEPGRFFAVPADDQILKKLVWPLRHALACYILENYLGTISLCGMVAEMVAILIYKISKISINEIQIDEDMQKKIFGRSFEKLGQEIRIRILKAINLIDDKLEYCFNTIKDTRKQYLHYYSQDHSQLRIDAIKVFNSAITITEKIIGQEIRKNKLEINPNLLKYLRQTGTARFVEKNK